MKNLKQPITANLSHAASQGTTTENVKTPTTTETTAEISVTDLSSARNHLTSPASSSASSPSSQKRVVVRRTMGTNTPKANNSSSSSSNGSGAVTVGLSALCIILCMFISMAIVFIIKASARENNLLSQNEALLKAIKLEREKVKEYVSLGLNGALFQNQQEMNDWKTEKKRREDLMDEINAAVEGGHVTLEEIKPHIPKLPMEPLLEKPLHERIEEARVRTLRFAAKNGHLEVLKHILTSHFSASSSSIAGGSENSVFEIDEDRNSESEADRSTKSDSDSENSDGEEEKSIKLQKEASALSTAYDTDLLVNSSLLHTAVASNNQDSVLYLTSAASELQKRLSVAKGTRQQRRQLKNVLEMIVGRYETPSSLSWHSNESHIAEVFDEHQKHVTEEKQRQRQRGSSSPSTSSVTSFLSSYPTASKIMGSIASFFGATKKQPLFSIDYGDHECQTPLMIAVKSGHTDMVRLLLCGKGNFASSESIQLLRNTVRSVTEDEKSHAENHPAVRNKNKHQNAHENSKEQEGGERAPSPPSIIDPIRVSERIVRWKVPNVDHTNCRGATALHMAVEAGNLEMVKLLVDVGKARVDLPLKKAPSTEKIQPAASDSSSAAESSSSSTPLLSEAESLELLFKSTAKDKCSATAVGPFVNPLHLVAHLPREVEGGGGANHNDDGKSVPSSSSSSRRNRNTVAADIVRFLIESKKAQVRERREERERKATIVRENKRGDGDVAIPDEDDEDDSHNKVGQTDDEDEDVQDAFVTLGDPTYRVTPLTSAIQSERLDIVGLLLKELPFELHHHGSNKSKTSLLKGEKSNIKEQQQDKESLTASSASSATSPSSSSVASPPELTPIQTFFASLDGHGASLLSRTIATGNVKLIQMVLGAMFDVNNNNGSADNETGVSSSLNEDQIVIVRRLLTELKDRNGWAPIHTVAFAIEEMLEGLLSFLLESGILPKSNENNEKTNPLNAPIIPPTLAEQNADPVVNRMAGHFENDVTVLDIAQKIQVSDAFIAILRRFGAISGAELVVAIEKEEEKDAMSDSARERGVKGGAPRHQNLKEKTETDEL